MISKKINGGREISPTHATSSITQLNEKGDNPI
jgi:hypothetical protein